MEQQNSLLKNTIALYIRMLFSICVNVYISRVILDVLGVEDYGVYSVVGGVVVLLGFINSSMAGSTSRFLSVAFGENDNKKLRDIYNAAKHLHFCVAVFILLVGETLGLWIVNGYLAIPQGRELAANIVYQLSLITVFFTIIQVPFSAIVISKENIDVYAKIEIINVLMKLAVVIFLPFTSFDRLLIYPFCLLIIAAIIYIIYKLYCRKSFHNLVYDNTIQMKIIRPMLIYSGWDMLGWGGVSMSTQGRQIFINKFFGVALNAANGLAATASGAIQAFTNNVIMAFRPRIIKCYASQDYNEMQRLTELALIGTILLMSFIFIPMILCMDYLLGIWLVEVPVYTLELCRLLLILQFLEAINTVVKIGIQASGILKFFTIAGFMTHLLNIVLTFILFRLGISVTSTYIIAISLCFINTIINALFVKHIIPAINIAKLFIICLRGGVVCLCGFLCCEYLYSYHDNKTLLALIWVLIANFIIVVVLTCVLNYSFVQPVYMKYCAKILNNGEANNKKE